MKSLNVRRFFIEIVCLGCRIVIFFRLLFLSNINDRSDWRKLLRWALAVFWRSQCIKLHRRSQCIKVLRLKN